MNKKEDSLLEKLKEMPQFVEVSGLQNEKNGLLNVMSGLYVKEEVNIVAKGERSKGGIGMINHLLPVFLAVLLVHHHQHFSFGTRNVTRFNDFINTCPLLH